MKVILNKDVVKLGRRGDIVNVKNGFFRNFLFPQNMADVATPAVEKLAAQRAEKKTAKREEILSNATDTLKKISGVKLSFKRKASDKGKLYGAIVETDIIGAVEKAVNVRLEKDFIKMEHLKEVGEHDVIVHLGEGLEETIKVVVDAE